MAENNYQNQNEKDPYYLRYKMVNNHCDFYDEDETWWYYKKRGVI